jgi:hypothetical protein
MPLPSGCRHQAPRARRRPKNIGRRRKSRPRSGSKAARRSTTWSKRRAFRSRSTSPKSAAGKRPRSLRGRQGNKEARLRDQLRRTLPRLRTGFTGPIKEMRTYRRNNVGKHFPIGEANASQQFVHLALAAVISIIFCFAFLVGYYGSPMCLLLKNEENTPANRPQPNTVAGVRFVKHRALVVCAASILSLVTIAVTVYYSTQSVIRAHNIPAAIVQAGNEQVLVDADGNQIRGFPSSPHSYVPFVMGTKDNRAAASLIRDVGPYPSVRNSLRTAQFLPPRQWDLLLADGLLIRLPEKGRQARIELASKMINSGKLKRAALIDLRSNDSIIVVTRDGATYELSNTRSQTHYLMSHIGARRHWALRQCSLDPNLYPFAIGTWQITYCSNRDEGRATQSVQPLKH